MEMRLVVVQEAHHLEPANLAATVVQSKYLSLIRFLLVVECLLQVQSLLLGGTAFCSGSTVSSTLSLSLIYSGVSGITYLWQQSTDNITYTSVTDTNNGATYTLPTSLSQTTYYRAIVTCTNGGASMTTAPITIAVTLAPVITTQPTAQTVCVGSAVTWSVTATNAASYQWRKGTTAISDATSATYTVTSATTGDAATNYNVVVTGNSPCTTPVTSNSIAVTISKPLTASNAGSNTTICDGTSTTLAANAPTSGTGAWSVTSGPNTASSQFSSTTNRRAT